MYIITPFLPNERNGVSKSLNLLLEKIKKNNKQIKIITSRSLTEKNSKLLRDYSIEFLDLEIKNIIKPINYFKNIKRYFLILKNLRNTKILIVCWHTVLTNLISIFCNHLNNSVIIDFYSHGTVSKFGTLPFNLKSILQILFHKIYKNLLMKKILKRVSYLYVLTNTFDSKRIDDVKYLIRKNPEKIILTSNEEFIKNEKYEIQSCLNNVPCFVIACRPTKQKGIHYLKPLISKISNLITCDKIKFVLCVPDKEDNLKKNIFLKDFKNNKILKDYIEIKFDINQDKLKKIFKLPEVYCINLSRFEYDPYGVNEPLSVGCPTFAFPAGGIKHIYGVNLYNSINELIFYIQSAVLIKSYRERLKLSSEVGRFYISKRKNISNYLF